MSERLARERVVTELSVSNTFKSSREINVAACIIDLCISVMAIPLFTFTNAKSGFSG